MENDIPTRLRGVAVGAAIGDALGMPLEFGPATPADRLVRDMRPGRLPAGAFTDDTEMALAVDILDPAEGFVAGANWLGFPLHGKIVPEQGTIIHQTGTQ